MANIFKAISSKTQQIYTNVLNGLYHKQLGTDPQTDDGSKKIYIPRGGTGLQKYSGYIFEDFDSNLNQKKGQQIYTEMRLSDPSIGAIMTLYENLIKQLDFTFEAASDKPQDIEAKEYMESVIADLELPWSDQLSEILNFLPYGSSLFEKNYKRCNKNNSNYPDNKIRLDSLSIRPVDSIEKWSFDTETGKLLGALQLFHPDWQWHFLPISKCVLFKTRSNKENPEGRSIFRNAYRSWLFKKNMENIEAIGVERDVVGTPLIYIDPSIANPNGSAEQKSAYEMYQKIGKNIKNHQQACIVLPSIFDEKGNRLVSVELLENKGSKYYDTNKIINRHDFNMLKSVLCEFINIGSEGRGSYALVEAKMDLFKISLNSIANIICDTINAQLIPSLIKLNAFQNLTDYPKMVHSSVENSDLDNLGKFINNVVSVGAITPDIEMEDFLRDCADLPNTADYKDTPTQRIANRKKVDIGSEVGNPNSQQHQIKEGDINE